MYNLTVSEINIVRLREQAILSVWGGGVAVQNVFGNITIILNQCRLHCVASNS